MPANRAQFSLERSGEDGVVCKVFILNLRFMNGLVSAFVNLWIYKFGSWQLTDFVSLRAYKFLSL